MHFLGKISRKRLIGDISPSNSSSNSNSNSKQSNPRLHEFFFVFHSPSLCFLSLSPYSYLSSERNIEMPFNFSAAHSSRISKRPNSRNPILKRSSSSPFNSLRRRKPTQLLSSTKADAEEDDEFFEDRLEEKCLVTCLTTDLSLRDVPQTIRYIHAHMFDPIPERGGMNSTRIAEILNFRKSLPPSVTVAHLHALIGSPTTTEREIAELTKAGIIRKILIPGRGTGASSISDGLVLVHDLEKLLEDVVGLDQITKGKKNLKYRRLRHLFDQ